MKKLVALAAAAFLLLLLLIAAAIREADAPASASAPPVTLEVKSGMTVGQVARALEASGAIRSALAFTIMAKVKGVASKIKVGEYEISPALPPSEILRQVAEGRAKLHHLTVPEGFTLRQIAGLAQAQGLCATADFIAAASDPALLKEYGIDTAMMKKRGVPQPNAEGYLMPDTYHFRKEGGAEVIVRTMLNTFRKKTAALASRAAAAPYSMHEMITLASIIEKEAAGPDEYPFIAAVFHNRLKRGMMLQADPTVIYAIPQFDGNIRKKDLGIDSRYNTYRYKGLPPGPIANPGMGALQAAFDPANAGYLYFVAMGSVKKHYFSATLREHNAAVRKYQLGKRG